MLSNISGKMASGMIFAATWPRCRSINQARSFGPSEAAGSVSDPA
jgi:hypothetical protein